MKNQIKAGVILQYAQMALAAVVSLVYTPIMIQKLGKAEYGIYNLASSVISYLSLLSLGFSGSYLRFYSRYKAENDERGIRRLNGLFLLVFSVIAGVALLCGLVLMQKRFLLLIFDEGLTAAEISLSRTLMIFLVINMVCSFPTSVFVSYITSQEKFIFQKCVAMLKTVVGPFVSIPMLLLGYGSIGVVAVTTAITLFADLLNAFFCLKKLKMKFEFKNPDGRLFREIFAFSAFIAIGEIIDQINFTLDKILIGRFRGSEEVSVYTTGSQLNALYMNFSSAIASVFSPRINRIVSEGKETWVQDINDLFLKVGRIQFFVLGLILTGFIFFGRQFIRFWVGDGFEDSYIIALLLIVPITIPLIQNIGLEYQRARNLHKFRSLIYLGMAGINVVLSIFFCRKWGAIGSAIGTTVSILLANGLAMNIYYKKRLDIDVGGFWKNIFCVLPAFICPVAVGVVMMKFVNLANPWIFVGGIVVYCIVYATSIWLFALNAYEKNLCLRPIKKILRKGEKK